MSHLVWNTNGDDETFENNLASIYDETVYWRKNVFFLPTGEAGEANVEKVSRLMNAWVNDSAQKIVAFKAVTVIPNQLLQQPSKKSKAKQRNI